MDKRQQPVTGMTPWHGLLMRFRMVLLLPCLLLVGTPAIHATEAQWDDVTRIVAVGDVHGDYDNFLRVLRDAGVVNRRGNWIAGETHLVQMGDVPDRGPDTAKVIALLQKLETQAARDGGRVHALIGNHEVMNMLGDLRYVHPGEYEAMRTRDSRRLRDAYYAQDVARREAANPEFVADAAFREQWEREIPLGMIEHQLAWRAAGEIGQWILTHNAVIRINRNLFVHGGISPAVLGMDISAINDQIRHELNGGLGEEQGLSEKEDGPLWYRGLAVNAPELERAHVEQLLATYNVDRVIIAHTPGQGTVVPRFDGRVLVIDAGIAAYYGGHLASLVLEDGQALTIQRGERIEVPTTDAGLLPYFQRIAELEPDATALQDTIRRLQSPTPP